jgi:hypothetical protein
LKKSFRRIITNNTGSNNVQHSAHDTRVFFASFF